MNTIKIHNVEIDEIIERDMTPEELAQWEFDKAAIEAEKAEVATKKAARQALLDKLGITADEARLLLG